MPIRRLPSELVDRIAAGEVVERPASVAKELLENAIDAGATTIQIELESGGCQRLMVSDDGAGIAGEELPLALLAHATSKLSSADDLNAIHTLGFRGEALASIAAVSRLQITSRRPCDSAGWRLTAEGGRLGEPLAIGCPVGTTVDVRDLFFNTPARRAFLRSPATEQAHLVEMAARVVLGTRRCGVVVTSGARRLLDLAETASELERVRQALGGRIDELLPFATDRGSVQVNGYLAGLAHQRGDARSIWTFVNGRFVRDRLLQRAILDGLRAWLAPGRFPLLALFVELDPTAVDVNVHPQKLELRFRAPRDVFKSVSNAIAYALGSAPVATSHQRSAVGPSATWWPAGAPEAGAPPLPSSEPRLRSLGRLDKHLLVCADGDDLVLIDLLAAARQHAVDCLSQAQAGGVLARHPLLLPEPLAITAKEAQLLTVQLQALTTHGFELVEVGAGQWSVRAVPACLRRAPIRPLLDTLLSELSQLDLATADVTARARTWARCAALITDPGPELEAEAMPAWVTALEARRPAGGARTETSYMHRWSKADLDRLLHRR